MPPAKPWWERNIRRAPWMIAAVTFAAIVVVLILLWKPSAIATLPAVGSFSGVVESPINCTGPSCPVELPGVSNLPPGVNVTVRWTDVSGGTAEFSIWSPFQQVCVEKGAGGVCSFVSVGGNYTFSAFNLTNQYAQQIDYNGTYD